jgi:predicted nucleotidyltransferase
MERARNGLLPADRDPYKGCRMTANPDDEARIAAVALARGVAASCEAQLGTRLLGAYLIGSLAHGSFNRRYSDIDYAVVTEEGLDAAGIAAIHESAAALVPGLAPKLSLFWTDRAFVLGRFPPLDRVDYLDFAFALAERERVLPARPTLAEIRAYLGAAPLTTWTNNALRCAAMTALDAKDHKLFIRSHLFPARLIYSWMTGRMGSNDVAVAFVRELRPAGLDVDLIARALTCRAAAADPDALFPSRTVLPAQFEACARLLTASD